MKAFENPEQKWLDLSAEAVLEVVLDLLAENEDAGRRGVRGWRTGVSPTAVCERLGLVSGYATQRPIREAFDLIWTICCNEPALTCTISGNTRRITIELDPSACPGCGCKPGEGVTEACTDPMGCGAARKAS